jgi:hypothetical protein
VRKKRNRNTLAKAIRQAPSAGIQAAIARHGEWPKRSVFYATQAIEATRALASEKRPDARALLETEKREAEQELARICVSALYSPDGAQTLRRIAEAIEANPQGEIQDAVRYHLAVLKLKIEDFNTLNGKKFSCCDIHQLQRYVGHNGETRAFRRILREMNFPYRPPLKSRTNKAAIRPSVS